MASTSPQTAAGHPVPLGEPSRTTRSAVAKQLFTGNYQSLDSVGYVFVWNAVSNDPTNHDANWRYLDSDGHINQIVWVGKDHAMTEEERTTTLYMESLTVGNDFGNFTFNTFVRVEKGKKSTSILPKTNSCKY